MKAMVIGLGRVGWSYSREEGRGFASSHFGAYYTHKDIESVIAVDSDEKRLSECERWFQQGKSARKVSKEVLFVKDYNEALKKYSPEIVSVCVPTSAHRNVMLDICTGLGPRVVCLEKPVTPSLREANEIAEHVARTYGEFEKPKVAVNFTRRWDERYQFLKSQVEMGRIGRPVLAIGLHPGPLLRSGIHMLDLFNWYLGKPNRVAGMVEAKANWMTEEFPETNDWSGNGMIQYTGDAYAILANMGLNMRGFVLFELSIYGTKGAIKVEDNGSSVRVREIQNSKRYDGLKELATLGASMPIQSAVDTPMFRMVNDLVDCAKDKNRLPQCTLDNGIQAQALVHLIRQGKSDFDAQSVPVFSISDVEEDDTINSH
jgi:predicted dehydrogenase